MYVYLYVHVHINASADKYIHIWRLESDKKAVKVVSPGDHAVLPPISPETPFKFFSSIHFCTTSIA